MKLLFELFGLCLGLVLALLWFGRIDHLRQIIPDHLPPEAALLENGSGLLAGRARLAPSAVLPEGGTVSWDFHTIAARGPVWTLKLAAPNSTGTARLSLPAPFGTAYLAQGRAALDLSALPTGMALVGELRMDQLTAAYRFEDRRLTTLTGQGQVLDLQIGPDRVGSGPLTLRADVGGAWRMGFDLTGPVAEINGRMSGRLGGVAATLEAQLSPIAGLPPRWRDALSLLGEQSETGTWQINTRLPP